ncbi:hypothetical protein MLD38_016845 [Melastoma candidum]|uniref:Uncharacterized protein n=1 Tax=Melastoma candidum TaxID=119954 RepID=A0ACB9QPA7_9MYRT|nr:hypothetical protein MLD38_016845 [Melastoma candidum]
MAEGGTTLEYTPTWIVAAVCTVIVLLSFIAERSLHYAGKQLKKRNQKPLFEALLKIKEELMLLGFISLLLAVFQTRIERICISESLSKKWLPCKLEEDSGSSSSTSHLVSFFTFGAGRRLLADAAGTTSSSSSTDYCGEKGKVALLSNTALHHLHIFIFTLAVVHVAFCALTLLLGGIKISMWKSWEDKIQKKEYDPDEVLKAKVTHVQDITFIKNRFIGIGKDSTVLGWLHAFCKQFYGSVTEADYITLRHGFIAMHCRSNPKFNFHKYMVRALEADFKKVVGISWYLWLFVVAFLLLNVAGWHAYFWISFVPLLLLLAVGAKLEHVITQLAQEVASKHAAIQGVLEVQPSDDHFWWHRPRLVLILIHIILFQNSFELAFFFFILLQYKWHSCIMGSIGFIIPRLVIGVLVQFLCSFSTLPLYAIVTQMGSSFKKAIFEEHVQEGLVGWAQKARRKNARKGTDGSTVSSHTHRGSSSVTSLEMSNAGTKESEIEDVESRGAHHVPIQSPVNETRSLIGTK